MEDLTRTQVIMLVLLVSFVTSLVTGIVTVTLVNQAPPPITQTINKVIEKTIETVTLSDHGQNNQTASVVQTIVVNQEDLVVQIIKDTSLAVVSVVASKDLPIVGTETRWISSGTGFFISEDGLIVTNKYIVEDTDGKYSIVTNSGEVMEVEVVALDSTNDAVILKIASSTTEKFEYIPLGDFESIRVGQTVIAIGNTLAESQNTVSVGVISGSRDSQGLIQTDAVINERNSGGPLLDLGGRVVGINTVISNTAENAGLALPINIIKRTIKDVKEFGEIVYPYIGIRYRVVDENIQKEKKLPFDYGLLIKYGVNSETAVTKDGPADKAGLREEDVIFEFNNVKLSSANLFLALLNEKRVGDDVWLKVFREGEEITVKITLEKRPKDL